VPILFVLFGFGSVIFRQKKSAVEQEWSENDEAQLTKLISKYQDSSSQVKQESGQ